MTVTLTMSAFKTTPPHTIIEEPVDMWKLALQMMAPKLNDVASSKVMFWKQMAKKAQRDPEASSAEAAWCEATSNYYSEIANAWWLIATKEQVALKAASLWHDHRAAALSHGHPVVSWTEYAASAAKYDWLFEEIAADVAAWRHQAAI